MQKIFRLLLIISLAFSYSCDFSSRTHKKILKAQQYLSDFQYQEAVDEYEQVVSEISNTELKVRVYYQLSEIYSLYLNDHKKAHDYLVKIIDESNDVLWKIKSLEKIADLQFNFFKDYNAAFKTYEKLYIFYPRLQKFELFYLMMGVSLLEANKFTEAQEIFQNILEEKSHSYRVRSFYYLGLLNFNLKNWDKAVSHWIEYIRRETDTDLIVRTKFLLGNVYETTEELDKAYDIYYSLLGEYPNPEVIKNRLKSIYSRRIVRNR